MTNTDSAAAKSAGGMVAHNTLVHRAMMFARHHHAGQFRKYTGNPYVDHLAEVAGIVATVDLSPITVATAWLHDVVEDCGVSLEEIENDFGYMVAVGVSGLSDVEAGNRAQRKAASRDRLALCSGWIQTIKCADLISNTSSIVKHDPKFAVTYLSEKRSLLAVLTRADYRLRELALQMCQPAEVPEAAEGDQPAFASELKEPQ